MPRRSSFSPPRALSMGLSHDITIDALLSSMHKHEVITPGLELGVPLELTLSYMNPRHGAHYGQCSKCRERRDAFTEAAVPDPTQYATMPLR